MHVDYFETLANLLDETDTAFGDFSEDQATDDYYSTVSPSTTVSSGTVLSPSGAANFDASSAVASSSASELDDLLDRMLEIQPVASSSSNYNSPFFGSSVDSSSNVYIAGGNNNHARHTAGGYLDSETMMTDSVLLEAAAVQHWSSELAAVTAAAASTNSTARCSLPLTDFYHHHHHHHQHALNVGGPGQQQAHQFTLPHFCQPDSAASYYATPTPTSQQQQPNQQHSPSRYASIQHHFHQQQQQHQHPQHQRYHPQHSTTVVAEENATGSAADNVMQCYDQFAEIYAVTAASQQQQQSRRSLRFPFERTVSSPEFYGPLQQYFPDLTNLHTGQSQSMPTFDANNSAAAAFDLDLHHHLPNYTPSPENLSTGSRSPTFYNNSGSFGYFCSSPSAGIMPHPQTLKSQKSLPLNQICAVCGDSAQCQHYGVRTCEGCKGFFKRTVQKKSKYVCLGTKDCVIDKRRRNRCQYCRFQKCLQVGMVREVVRTDSLKGRRGRLPSKSKSGGEEYSITGSLSLTKALYQAFTSPSVETDHSMTTVRSADHLMDSVNASFMLLHRLAEKIPGWQKITVSDRLALLHSGAVNVLSLKVAQLSMNVVDERRVVFEDGCSYLIDSCDKHWQPWLEAVLDLSKNLKLFLDKDLTGFCCLSALALLKYENLHLENVEEVDKLKNNVINCLKEHCTYSAEAKNKPSQYFATILSKLIDLNAITLKAGECYETCKWEGIQLPIVVGEIFSRISVEPKCCHQP